MSENYNDDDEFSMDEDDDTIQPAKRKISLDTGWAKEPTVAELKQDLLDSDSDHDSHVSDVDTWLDNLNVTGTAEMPKVKGKSNLVPKLIRKQAEWRYSSLSEPFLSTEDVFNVSPVTYDDKAAAEQNALVLNYQFNYKINKVTFIDEFVRTAVDEGTVIVRVGWDFREEEQDVEIPVYEISPVVNQQEAQQIQQLIQISQADPEKAHKELPAEVIQALHITIQTGVPTIARLTGSRTETQMVTTRNVPTLEICPYQNVHVDPSCKGVLSKAEFVIYEFESSLSELEKEGKYANLDKIQVDANSILNSSDYYNPDDSSFNFADKPRTKFKVYEYWGFRDIDGSGITRPIVATWVGDQMIRLEENPFPDNAIPFVSAQYLPVRKSVYGEPDGELLEDNQKIVGAVSRGIIDSLGRSANGQQGVRKDALDITNKRKFDQGKDYEFSPNVDPRQAFYMHTYPEISSSAELVLSMQNAEAESLTGVKSFNSGISGQALGSTATGIRSALDATSKRELGILRRLAACLKDAGRKIISMNAVFLSEEEVVRLTNEEFVTVKRDDLTGSFDIDLSISTAEADDNKAQELAFMLQTIGNNMDPMISQMILSDIASLRKMPVLSKALKDYKPEPDPLQQEQAMLQIELLKAQVQNELAKANENNANAALDNAKAQNELVSASNTQSDTDQKNLDYVEQESGVTQERELQKQSQQAKSQGAMKILESGLKMNEEKNKAGMTESNAKASV